MLNVTSFNLLQMPGDDSYTYLATAQVFFTIINRRTFREIPLACPYTSWLEPEEHNRNQMIGQLLASGKGKDAACQHAPKFILPKNN